MVAIKGLVFSGDNRLLAIEAEKQNAEICDYVVQMKDPKQAAGEIFTSLHLG